MLTPVFGLVGDHYWFFVGRRWWKVGEVEGWGRVWWPGWGGGGMDVVVALFVSGMGWDCWVYVAGGPTCTWQGGTRSRGRRAHTLGLCLTNYN